MRILVVGGGGREHALCWKIRQSPEVTDLFCAPGNPGIAEIADPVPIAPDEVKKLADFAADMKIDLTVVGPELPLTLGLVDELRSRGLAVFGPTARAAELEGSKVFAKELMARHGIPTAAFEVVHDAAEAHRVARRMGLPLVVKAEGLAAGKGVLMCPDQDAFDQAVETVFEERRFGSAGDRVVIEELLEGEEASFMVLADGERVLPLATAKDYKRAGEDDTGPNTGGMGSHSPSGVVSGEMAARVLDEIVRPTVEAMAREDRPFTGVLYTGLMLTAAGPKVLEYNVRFGDPEAQVLLLRLEDDLVPILTAGARGAFGARRLHFKREAAACVVLASPGYPGSARTGDPIGGLDSAALLPGVQIFHAGTAQRDGEIVSAGGRVLNVCATGAQLVDALKRAYQAAALVDWPGKVYRRDIGRRVLTHAASGSQTVTGG
jgi:phosphoribosylamine---glycine ligase